MPWQERMLPILKSRSTAPTQLQGSDLNCYKGELLSDHAAAMNDLPKDMASYMNYIYSFLSSDNSGIVQRDKIDQNSQEYQAWKAGTISLRDYIYSGIAGNWVDTTRLATSSKYSMQMIFTAS